MKDLLFIAKYNGKIPVTYRFGKGHHDVWEVIYYCEGTGFNIIDGTKYEFFPGMIICQPPHVDHEEISDSGYINFNFKVGIFDISDRLPVVVHDTINGDCLDILNKLYGEFIYENDSSVTDALLQVLTVYIIRLIRDKTLSPYTNRLKHEIIENLANPDFSILEAIKKIPAPEKHIRSMFENDVGMSPKSYLQFIRTEHAKKLLEGTTRPIDEISSFCGYEDPCYFSRVFKKYCGTNPRSWRKTRFPPFK